MKNVFLIFIFFVIASNAFGGGMRKGYYFEFEKVKEEIFSEFWIEIEIDSMGQITAEKAHPENTIERNAYALDSYPSLEELSQFLEKDKRINYVGNPYILAVNFSSIKSFKYVRITELVLINEQNRKEYLHLNNSNLITSEVRQGTFISSFVYWDELKNVVLDYSDYRIEALYEICFDDSVCKSGKINKLIKKNYTEKKSFDFIEAIKGI